MLRSIVTLILILQATLHQGTLLTLLLVHEFVVDTVVEVCIVVLLVDTVLLPALRAELDDLPRHNELCYFLRPLKRRIFFFLLNYWVPILHEHGLYGVEGG